MKFLFVMLTIPTILMLLLLSGCGTVEIKNTELCWDAGTQGAICENTLNDDERILDYPQWEKERFLRACITPEDFGELKEELEKLCLEKGKCSYEVKKKLEAFSKHHEEVMKKLPKHPDGENYEMDNSNCPMCQLKSLRRSHHGENARPE